MPHYPPAHHTVRSATDHLLRFARKITGFVNLSTHHCTVYLKLGYEVRANLVVDRTTPMQDGSSIASGSCTSVTVLSASF